MAGDELSEVFELAGVRGVLSGGIAARGPWVSRAAIEDPLASWVVLLGHGDRDAALRGVCGPAGPGPI